MDIRYSLRLLRKSPLFTCSAIVALALGIGANTAVFSVVDSVLLRPLPYHDPSRLVTALHDGHNPVSPADFLDYKKSATSFETLGAAQGWGGNISGLDKPEAVSGLRVTADLFAALGIEPQLGRVFQRGEDQPGAEATIILSDALWRRDFGARRDIIGERVSIDGVPHTIIGVMPRGFGFPPFWLTRAEMWAPLDLSNRLTDRDGRSLRVFGRLRPGVSVDAAQAEMSTIASRLAAQYPQTNTKLGITVQPLMDQVTGPVRPLLFVLLGTVSLVLLIACANVANLLLARASSRRREIAVRIAMGARARDIIRQLLTESTVVSTLGGVAGFLAAMWALSALKASLPPGSLPRQGEISINGAVLCFTAGVSILAGLIAGLLPALQLSRGDVNEDLKSGSKGTAAATTSRARSLLIVAEVALGVVLLAGAGLMIRTLAHLLSVDPGFNPQSLLAFEVSTGGTTHDANGRRALLFRNVRDRVSSLNSIRSVSAINHLPLAGDMWRLGFLIDGRPAPPPGVDQSAVYRVVLPKYFETMQIKLESGRDFDEHDNEQSQPVVIINQAMARQYWPGENPIGRAIVMRGASDLQARSTIVGITADAKQGQWTKPAAPEIYFAYLQRPDSMGLRYMTFVARTAGDPQRAVTSIEQAVSAVDRNVPVSHVETMERVISNDLWRPRMTTILLACFGAIALLLATIGIYGVISYQVGRRTSEIGIRMALGAGRTQVLSLVLGDGMRPVITGAVLGLGASMVATRWMEGLLYGVQPADPGTLAGVTAILLVVGAAANLVPAFRASRLNPVVALRVE